MPDPYIKSFSRAILDGLSTRRPAVAADLFAGRTVISGDRIAAVARGDGDFTDDEIGLIEDLSDLTGLQLAAVVVEPGGGPLTDMADGWAVVRDAGKSAANSPADAVRSAVA